MAIGRFGDPADGECVLVRAHDADGVLSGLLHLGPWGSDGLLLDLMRRNHTSEDGLVAFMVAALVAAAPALGVRHILLNFAVFRAVFARGERMGAGSQRPATSWGACWIVATPSDRAAGRVRPAGTCSCHRC